MMIKSNIMQIRIQCYSILIDSLYMLHMFILYKYIDKLYIYIYMDLWNSLINCHFRFKSEMMFR